MSGPEYETLKPGDRVRVAEIDWLVRRLYGATGTVLRTGERQPGFRVVHFRCDETGEEEMLSYRSLRRL